MLSFETPHFEIEGIVCYPDHEDPRLFYYTAAMPTIARGARGRPMFDLWVYTEDLVHDMFAGTTVPDEMGGGFLTFGANCRRDERDLRQLRRGLAELLDVDDENLIKLSPIPYKSGQVRLIALDAVQPAEGIADPASPTPNAGRERFITNVVATSLPALMGDLQSIFSLSLSERGAAFMAGLFETSGTPVGVTYELVYEGLSPAVDVTVTADMSKLRTHFGGGIEGQVKWFKADISAAIDHLKQEQVVKVDSTRFIDTDAAREAETRAIALFKEDIIQQLFRPSTPATPQPGPGESIGRAIADASRGAADGTDDAVSGAVAQVAGGSIGFSLKFEHETQHLSGTYNYSARMPVERTDAPQAFLQSIVDEGDMDTHVTQIDLGSASIFFDRIEAAVSLPSDETFEALNLRQATVSVAYGDGDPSTPPSIKPPLICRPGGDRHRLLAFQRDGRKSMSVSYDITYEFDDPPGEATVDRSRYVTERKVSTSRSIMIDPTSDFGFRRMQLRPGRIPEDVREVDVLAAFRTEDGNFTATKRFNLRAPFNRSIDEMAPDGADWPIRTRAQEPGVFDVTETFVFADGSKYARPARNAPLAFHTIDAPFTVDRTLLVQPNIVTPTVEAIDVEVEYDDTEASYHRRFRLAFAAPWNSQELRWPIIDQTKQAVRIRTSVRDGGITTVGDWIVTDTASHVVGDIVAPPSELTLRLIGDDMIASGFDGVLVEVRAPNAAGDLQLFEHFFAPGEPLTTTFSLHREPGQPVVYEFRTQAFKVNGDIPQTDWTERSDSLSLIIPLRTL